jgi:hypothetical protein
MRIIGTAMAYLVTLNLIVSFAHPGYASMTFHAKAWLGAVELIVPILAAIFAWEKLK